LSSRENQFIDRAARETSAQANLCRCALASADGLGTEIEGGKTPEMPHGSPQTSARADCSTVDWVRKYFSEKVAKTPLWREVIGKTRRVFEQEATEEAEERCVLARSLRPLRSPVELFLDAAEDGELLAVAD
jgi:hypothetical protein